MEFWTALMTRSGWEGVRWACWEESHASLGAVEICCFRMLPERTALAMWRCGMPVSAEMVSALKLLKAGGNTTGGEGAEGGLNESS